MAIQGGIAAVASILVFPESVGHAFQGKLGGILNPLSAAMLSIEQLFSDAGQCDALLQGSTLLAELDPTQCPSSEALDIWADKSKAIKTQLLQSLAGLPPLRAQQRYLSVDFSYSHLSGHDLRDLFDLLAIVQTRSGGLAFFFDVVLTSTRHSHLDSSAFSVQKVAASRPGSRTPSIREMTEIDRGGVDEGEETVNPEIIGNGHDHLHVNPVVSRMFHMPAFLHHRSGSPLGSGHRDSLFDFSRKTQRPVGVYESQRYMDVERVFSK